MDRYCRRLIEVDLPIRRISAHARREKSIRHGNISTLHVWWARRPVAACRAVICATLWPDPCDERCPESFRDTARLEMQRWATAHIGLVSEASWRRFMGIQKNPERLRDNKELRNALLDFIADYANWDNSTVDEYLKTSRTLTQVSHISLGGEEDTRPLALDPFAGGGAIPLEALRVGADCFGSDINPVAFLLNKVLLEFVPKYGGRLSKGVENFGETLIEAVSSLVDEFYPPDPDGSIPVAYLWARTVKCEGPGCGVEVPLLRSLVLAQRGGTRICLKLLPDAQTKTINFQIVEDAAAASAGTVRRSSADCPLCGYATPAKQVRAQFVDRRGGANDARLVAVVITSREQQKKSYRIANERDLTIVAEARSELERRVSQHTGNLTLTPTEELPYLRSIFNIHLLGVTRWCDLFTDRQLLILTAMWEKVRAILDDKDAAEGDRQFVEACATCAALAVDRVSAQYTSLAWWHPKGEFVVGTFGRQALGIIWDFAELRPIHGASGDLNGAIEWVVRVLKDALDENCMSGQAGLVSATKLPLPDDSAAVLVTDPPYYDAVPYADLSDFFYTQLKRMLAGIYPSVFADELTPKEGEIVQLAERNRKYAYKTKEYFEDQMQKALAEGRRVLAPSGACVVVFAHKTTAGWEALLSALIGSGWIVTASWPIDTERTVRMRAKRSATLSSSVHLVCRPRENADGSLKTDAIGDWRTVLAELPIRLHGWMPRLAEEGVVGADAIFACLGPALEIFSRYSSVEKASGENVTLREYLEEVWAAVSREALTMIFEGADASGFEEDARLTAMWLWTLHTEANGDDGEEDESGKTKSIRGYSLEYDAARKIAQGLGAHLEDLSHLVEVKGDTATLLAAGARTKYLFGKDVDQVPRGVRKKKAQQMTLDFAGELQELEEEVGDWAGEFSGRSGSTVLDQLHQSMILFGAGRGEALRRFLVEDSVGYNPLYWRLAQSFSALYPHGTDEKRWVDGVLARKKGLGF